MSAKTEKVVSFRLEGEALSRLEHVAMKSGVSIHEWAKKALLRELDGENQIPKLTLQGEALKQELIEVRRDIAVATEALLLSAGKSNAEQAAKFVKANLRRE